MEKVCRRSLKKSDSERKGREQGRPGHRSYSFPMASEKEQLGDGVEGGRWGGEEGVQLQSLPQG